jgi:hypothetical protein
MYIMKSLKEKYENSKEKKIFVKQEIGRPRNRREGISK